MKNKKYNFIVEWKKGSINDNIVRYLQQNNINFHYNRFRTLVADLYRTGQYFKFGYERIYGDIYGISATAIEEENI